MSASMVLLHAHLNGALKIRRLRISLPRIDCLVDGRKYYLPGDEPTLVGEDFRPFNRPKVRSRGHMSTDDRRFIEKRATRRREDREYEELGRVLGDPI